ncbi:MAG TPA: DUF3267 domain-containing protein [Thermoanaerobaculia bacterium]|jgi:hypothetical protein
MTPDELSRDEYQLLAEMTHATLSEFVVEYFFRRVSWLTRTHHGFSLVTLAAAIAVAVQQGRGFGRAFLDFGLAFVVVVVILPLHEGLHAAAYRVIGARDVRWDYSPRMLAIWVVAHRFVVSTRPFVFVALAPFVVLNALLVAAALAFPQQAVLLLFVLLLHLHGCAGDWSLLNFIWLHRERGFWTYDDAEEGRSYFFGRAG